MRALVLVLVLAGCGITEPTDRLDFTNQRPLDPPEVYAVWYAEVEDSLQLQGSFASVEWFVADQIRVDGTGVGSVLEPPNRITLARHLVPYVSIVKFEIERHVRALGRPYS